LHTLQRLFNGLQKQYSLKLNLVGLGFKINILDNNLIELKLGFSHSIFYELPSNIQILQPKDRISIYLLIGPELSKLTQVFASLRKLKKPEPYKGKGIRYFNEIIKLKEGKKNNG
jgi:large subunit ribosomal protein L6